jgi:hypothetical protein
LKRQRFDLGELVNEVLERMRGVSTQHRLIVEHDGPALVDAD